MAPIISNFLFHHDGAPIDEKKDYVKLKIEIRDALKEPAFRRILTEILLDLQKDVSGETKKKLNNLYCELDLHLDAYKKLKSWRWEIVSQGIRELTQMSVTESYRFITQFLNDRRGVIRKQAEIATVSLRDEGLAHFLDTTSYSISEWQQLKLMEVLRGMEHFRPPSFKTWLVSRNKAVVLFALRLIRQYNQNEASASIIELVKHKDERIREEAVLCIKEFCLLNALPILKTIFRNARQSVKIEILDTIATLGNEEDLEFLKAVIKNESSFMVKNKAQMALNEIQPESIMPSIGLISTKELNKEIESQQQNDELLQEEIRKIATDSNDDTTYNSDTAENVEIDVFEVDIKTISIEAEHIEPEEVRQSSDVSETEIEIGLITEEMDSSVNTEIGLIAPRLETEEPHDPEPDMSDSSYLEMTDEERLNFIELLEENASDRELMVLERIVQNEPSSELRFRIFNIIKSIKEEKPKLEASKNRRVTLAAESIFYDLFEYASDLDAKSILIKEMAEIGDERELPLLDLLVQDANAEIKAIAKKCREQLLSKLNQQNETAHHEAETEEFQGTNETTAGLLPLELCFLEEFGIEPPNEEDGLEISFELADDFYSEQDLRPQTIKRE